MKKTGRLLALLLAMLLVLSLNSMAFADEGDVGSSALAAASTPEPTTTTNAINDNETGIIDKTQLDNWMENFMARHSLTGSSAQVSVGFYYSGTGDSWYYNADVWMYSASLYKAPVSMLVAEKEAAGEITQDTFLTTSEGSGTVGYLESTALTYSNNTSGHALVDYMGGTYSGKCADMAKKYTTLPDSYYTDSNFQENSYYTARFMTQVMTTLLNDSSSYPHVVEYLLEAQPGEYYKKTVSDYDIAQKYGAYEEKNGTNNNHCSAIIYTPSPIVVTVMTTNVSDYEDCIGEIGKMLADYSLTLDENLEAYTKSQAEAAAAAEEAAKAALAAQTADAAAATEAANANAEGTQTVESTPVATEAPAAKSSSKTVSSAILFTIALLALILIALVIVLIVEKIRRRNRYDDYDDDGDYDDEEDEEDNDWEEEAPRGRKSGKKAVKAAAPKKASSRRARYEDEYEEDEPEDEELEEEPEEDEAEEPVQSYEAKPEPYQQSYQRPAQTRSTGAAIRPIARPKAEAVTQAEPETVEAEPEETPVHRGFVSFNDLKKQSRAAKNDSYEAAETYEAEPVQQSESAEAPRGRHSAPSGSHSSSSTSHIDRSNYKPRH